MVFNKGGQPGAITAEGSAVPELQLLEAAAEVSRSWFNKRSCWKRLFISGRGAPCCFITPGDAWGGAGDGADLARGGGVSDAIARGRGGRGTGPATDGEVGARSGCPAPGVCFLPAGLGGSQVRGDSHLTWCNFYPSTAPGFPAVAVPAPLSAASFPLPLQNRQTFNSLTCLSAAAEDGSPQLPGPRPWTAAPCSPEVMPGRTPACTPVPEPPRSRADERRASRDDLSCEEEEEGGGKEEDRAAWRSGGTGAESLFQLDGEIDIEQIENN